MFMMKNMAKLLTGLILITAAIRSYPGAQELSAAGSAEFPFIAEPVYPGNQIDPDSGYWYVDTVKGKAENFTANVKNTGTQPITVDIEPADCYTSTGGDLCYITNNKSPLVGLSDNRFMLAGNISLPVRKIVLSPGEASSVSFGVKAPDIDEGEVLGGVRFSVTRQGSGTGGAAGGNAQLNLNIRNAITITVRLRYKAPANLSSPGFSIGDAGFDPDTGSVYFYLNNLLPLINRDVRGSYDVYDGNNTRLFGGSFDMVRMAPESVVRFPVKWNSPNPGPGDYSILVLPSYASVPETRAVQLGSGDVQIIDTESPPAAAPQEPGNATGNKFLFYGGWILFSATLLVLIIFLIVRRKKHNDKAEL